VSASGDPAVRILMQTGVLKAFIQIVLDKKTCGKCFWFQISNY